MAEFEGSQAGPLKAMRERLPFLPADSARWAPEMDEIAETFGAVGVTEGFHRAAGEIYRLMARTPLSAETRETLDRSRTLEEALADLRRRALRTAHRSDASSAMAHCAGSGPRRLAGSSRSVGKLEARSSR